MDYAKKAQELLDKLGAVKDKIKTVKSLKEAAEAVPDVVKLVEGVGQDEDIKGSDKKALAVAILNELIDIPFLPESVEGMEPRPILHAITVGARAEVMENTMFSQKGYIGVKKDAISEDELMNLALEAGADDIQNPEGSEYYDVYTTPAAFEAVKAALEAKKLPIENAEVTMIASTEVKIETVKDAEQILKLMPVATQASVKALSDEDIRQAGAECILSNTYHLYLRPGTEVLEHFGGLHKFMTTWISALFLFQFGSGPVKGFAVTLTIGLLVGMFTAVFVTRAIYEFWLTSSPKELSI